MACRGETDFITYMRRRFGPGWAICRNTERNRARHERCILRREYDDAVASWKRDNPQSAAEWFGE